MLPTGTLQLFKVKAEGAVAPPGVYGITHLGYPIYLLTILGIWKIFGVVALLCLNFLYYRNGLMQAFSLPCRERYFSHIASGDSVNEIFPALLLLILTIVSWYFRPVDRKVISVNQ